MSLSEVQRLAEEGGRLAVVLCGKGVKPASGVQVAEELVGCCVVGCCLGGGADAVFCHCEIGIGGDEAFARVSDRGEKVS